MNTQRERERERRRIYSIPAAHLVRGIPRGTVFVYTAILRSFVFNVTQSRARGEIERSLREGGARLQLDALYEKKTSRQECVALADGERPPVKRYDITGDETAAAS